MLLKDNWGFRCLHLNDGAKIFQTIPIRMHARPGRGLIVARLSRAAQVATQGEPPCVRTVRARLRGPSEPSLPTGRPSFDPRFRACLAGPSARHSSQAMRTPRVLLLIAGLAVPCAADLPSLWPSHSVFGAGAPRSPQQQQQLVQELVTFSDGEMVPMLCTADRTVCSSAGSDADELAKPVRKPPPVNVKHCVLRS